MLRTALILVAGIGFGYSTLTSLADAAVPTAVVCAKDANSTERFAAKEIRRYVYLRTATLLPIVDGLAAAPGTR